MFTHQTDGACAIAQGVERMLVCFLLDHENSKPWRDGLLQGAGIHLPAIDVDYRAREVSRQRRTAENSEVCIGPLHVPVIAAFLKALANIDPRECKSTPVRAGQILPVHEYKSMWETLVMQSSGEDSEGTAGQIAGTDLSMI